ncbi:MAG: amino acid oxidase, partial [Cyanobacteriota bacterium]|nr:amino acid oxidase [Cyanobacteriota bacterium]
LWLACGHHRNGVLLAAITAELTAASLQGIPLAASSAALLNSFHWSRF